MGTYLSTPVTEKHEECGESLKCPQTPVAWGVVDMQGWRKSMEDAHVAQTDIDVPAHHFEDSTEIKNVDAKVFGVFDGHGGPEVANFCQLYLTSVLTQQPTWQEETLDETPEDAESSDIGKALVSCFHALDRMVDDSKRRDELIRLRAIKPSPGERKEAHGIPPPPGDKVLDEIVDPSNDNNDDKAGATTTTDESGACLEESKSPQESGKDESVDIAKVTMESPAVEGEEKEDASAEITTETNENTAATDTLDQAENDVDSDTDSDEAVGKEEAAKIDQDLTDDEADEVAAAEEEAPVSSTAEKVTEMFQRFLNISGQSGQLVVQVDESTSVTREVVTADGSTVPAVRPPQELPSMYQNGRLICNLPDHPIHAGATAVVAVIVGKTLTVANAGDSRAVLCRANGATFALSYDHKPQSDIERNRIQKAGGFVNQVGRVNGNLNLSRSIGDLKYKQVEGISKAEQMITAQPDILQTKLEPTDEFIVIGCDGIWDCLSNEGAVEYVRTRIESKTPNEIGIEMLNDIISEDPRVTAGIGGDNMTIMIIDLQPQTRSYRKSEASPI